MYCNIFRAGFTTRDDLHAMRGLLDETCVGCRCDKFTVDEFRIACEKLKPKKKDAVMYLNSFAFKHVPNNVLVTFMFFL